MRTNTTPKQKRQAVIATGLLYATVAAILAAALAVETYGPGVLAGLLRSLP